MRVLIVGGSSSIGREVVSAFAARGDDILATWARHPLNSEGKVRWERLDLLKPASLKEFAKVLPTHGPIEAAVFLSGILPGKSLPDYEAAEMQEVMTVNVTGQAQVLQLLLPHLAPGASVLLMSSIYGRKGSYDPIFAASKAALIGLTQSLATWHGKQARFNCLAPALVEGSAMDLAMAPERRRHHRESSPTGTLLASADLARVIVDLTGPQWKHLNGAVIPLDGGRP